MVPDRIPVPGFQPRPAEKRKPLTPKQRQRLIEEHKWICCLCGKPIEKGSRWIDEHIIALELGGSNAMENRGPAHEACAVEKTKSEAPLYAKGRRIRGETCTKPRGRKIQNRGFQERKTPFKWPKRKFGR